MDNPIGDPFGGPAYGKQEDPFSMIAAVVAIGVGVSTVAAATTLTLAAVMGGLMIAGGAASLIGTVSGNKQLAMIGGIVAGVGGLGLGAANLFADSAASAAGSLSEVASANAEGMSAMTQAGMSFDQQASVFSQIQSGNTAGAMDALTKAGLSFDQQAAIFNGAAQSAAFDPSTIMQTATTVAPDTASNGLIKNALDTGNAGEVANVAPNTVDDMVNTMQTQINDAGQTPLRFDQNSMSASNQAMTDVPVQSSATPQNLDASAVDKFSVENNPNVFDAGYTSGEQVGSQGFIKPTAEEVLAAQKAGDPNYIPVPGGTPPAGQSSWLDKIEGIAKGIEKYKTTANIGGNLISGAMKYAIPSQTDQAAIDLYNAKANLANQEAAAIASLEERKRRQNEAVKNLKPVQLNNSMNPIFGNALNGAGIINSARA